jgi:hypothetical protein
VDGRLGYETVPPGDLALGDMLAPIRPHPNTNFDFFPYCGFTARYYSTAPLLIICRM